MLVRVWGDKTNRKSIMYIVIGLFLASFLLIEYEKSMGSVIEEKKVGRV